MDCLELKTREPKKEDVEEMNFYLKTGCVHQEYLDKVLGDQSIGISIIPKQYFN
jgi:hypothetical protein